MKTFMFLCLSSLVTPSTTPDTKEDEKALRAIVQTMESGWNAKSGQQFASVFAEIHDYVVVDGMYFRDQPRQNNAFGHQHIFDSVYKNTDLKMKVDKIKFLRDDLALVHILGATFEHGTPVPEHPEVIISMLAEKKNNTWSIIAFHNCDIEMSFDPAAPRRSQIPPQTMYASWYNQ